MSGSSQLASREADEDGGDNDSDGGNGITKYMQECTAKVKVLTGFMSRIGGLHARVYGQRVHPG